jgi:hypothetical protein
MSINHFVIPAGMILGLAAHSQLSGLYQIVSNFSLLGQKSTKIIVISTWLSASAFVASEIVFLDYYFNGHTVSSAWIGGILFLLYAFSLITTYGLVALILMNTRPGKVVEYCGYGLLAVKSIATTMAILVSIEFSFDWFEYFNDNPLEKVLYI